jgi:hypothetical protein
MVKSKSFFSRRINRIFSSDLSLSEKPQQRTESLSQTPRVDRFALCRSHITQLGLMMFENRQNIDLLNTSKTNCDQLLRELKNLDTLNCRETHKIGNKKTSNPPFKKPHFSFQRLFTSVMVKKIKLVYLITIMVVPIMKNFSHILVGKLIYRNIRVFVVVYIN